MAVKFVDSFDKIVGTYFAGVATEEFTYKSKLYAPKTIRVSPGIFRGTTCPAGCGGCCFRFALLWLQSDILPTAGDLRPRTVSFNGHTYLLYTDPQTDHDQHFCRHVDQAGRCGIHGRHPFTCDFELLRFTHQKERVMINTRLFGRGWQFTRITGQKGALCDYLPVSDFHRDEAARKLRRLWDWTHYFGLKTRLPEIIEWVDNGPHTTPLVLQPHSKSLEARIGTP